MLKALIAVSVALLLSVPVILLLDDGDTAPHVRWGSGADSSQPSRSAAPTRAAARVDRYGVRKLQPTRRGGMTWTSKWHKQRRFKRMDPRDPWFDTDHGRASYSVSRGKLRITGDVPRLHIHHPRRARQWRDVEITMYFKRIRDDGVPYAGMVSVARTNHGVSGRLSRNPCDSRGLGARMRYDGDIDFDKETSHPYNDTAASKSYWRRGMPMRVWIGYKHLVYDLPKGNVRQELWIDRSGGRNGGRWVRINKVTDNGQRFGRRACAPGINPKMRLTNNPKRRGSESGKPNRSVYFRSDGVRRNGLIYKWGSVREINVNR